MNKRWSDFYFAIGVRFVCGTIIGGLAGLLLGYRVVLRLAARDNTRGIGVWLVAWAVGGALIAVFRIPHWQKPWYKGVQASAGCSQTSANYNFRRVRPEFYNRAAHPSLKQFHDFVRWLREITVVELECVRGDLEATKAAFFRFFQRGFKAGLTVTELTELLPPIVCSAGYSEAEGAKVVAMLKGLTVEELQSECNDKAGVSSGD